MRAFLKRLFPLQSDPAAVSNAWLTDRERAEQRRGWEDAPLIDWTKTTFTKPRRQPQEIESVGSRFL